MSVSNDSTSSELRSEFQQAESIISQSLTRASFPNNLPIAFQPQSFFISWNGVLCLVFRGFPPAMEELKRHLNDECAQRGYKNENFGSKWAKVTLAGVNESSVDLSLGEFHRLKNMCIECSAPFATCDTDPSDKSQSSDMMVPIKTISLVEYEWRSLEKLSQVKHFEITPQHDESSLPTQEVSLSQQQKTNGVLSEWDDEEAYLPNVNAKGAPYRPKNRAQNSNNSCDSSSPARQMSETKQPLGLTCVSFLDLKFNHVLWQCITDLKEKLEKEFPRRYEWMEANSLHCTVRAMDRC